MNIKLQVPALTHLRPRITVVGVGGAGSNAVNNMIASGLSGVNFVVANTDAQSLVNSSAENRIQLGASLTEGLGAGARPEIGKAAAEETMEEIRAQVAGSHMVFVAAGMGGGTGTGAAAVIARIARESGALTVGVVTKPFHFEGSRRMRAAEGGIAALKPEVDTLIVIPNQNLFRIANERTTFAEAFVLADQVLFSGIACVVDLIVKEGMINLDFADVRSIMSGMGTAMMGTGEASGEKRAVLAAEEAISNPLLDDISLRGARGLLVSITGSRELKLYEVDEAAQRVRQEVDGEANIIVGATFDDSLGDRIRVSIVASGMERLGESAPRSQPAMPVQAGTPQPVPPLDNEPPFIEPYPDPGYPPSVAAPGQRQEHHASLPASQLRPQIRSTLRPDFARALSEALDSSHEAPAQRRLSRPAQPSGSDWMSDSGAVFHEGPPQFGTDPLTSLGAATTQRPPAPEFGFHPQPPAEIQQNGRRLPAVEDFPEVGQREYRAKSYQYAEEASTSAPAAVAPRFYRKAQSVAAPKPGLFARLFGGWRKPPAEPHTSASYTQAPDRPANIASAPQHSQPPRRVSNSHDARRDDSEDHELPTFFGTARK